MNTFKIMMLCLLLAGCQSMQQVDENGIPMAQRTLLDRIEFDEDESGCVEIVGEIDLNTSIFFSSTAHITLKKVKRAEGQETVPEC